MPLLVAQSLLHYCQRPQVHATPTEKCNEYLAEANFVESIKQASVFQVKLVLPLFLAQRTSYATAFDLQLL